MTTYESAKYNYSGANITAIPTSAFTSGTFADARLAASNVTQHVTAFDDKPLRNDVAVLALHSAITDNKVAYNLPNSFIDQFQDDSGYDGSGPGSAGSISTDLNCAGDVDRDPNDGGEFFSSVYEREEKVTTAYAGGDAARSSTSHVGSYSVALDGSGDDYVSIGNHCDFIRGTGDWTVEGHFNFTYVTSEKWLWSGSGISQGYMALGYRGGASPKSFQIQYWNGSARVSDTTYEVDLSANTWYHLALVGSGGNTIKLFKEGTLVHTLSSITYNQPQEGLDIGWLRAYTTAIGIVGFVDEFRISNNARYSSSFSAPTAAHTPDDNTMALLHMEDVALSDDPRTIDNAAGTLIGNQQTANASQTKVSGVILYKDNAGTATLGTDLKIYFTCNGGTNWTEAASYGTVGQVFATGIKMIRLGETTCTAGTGVKYKAVWANQSEGSKETQLHGIGINY